MRAGTLAAILLVAGCATLPVAREIQRSFDYEASFAEVWTAVIDVFGELNLPIGDLERDSGLITTDWIAFNLRDGYADCGSPGLNITQNHMGRFNVVVRSSDGGTRMTVNTSFQVDWVFEGNRQTIQCVSTGALERRISEDVASRL